jgi:hypothetical protein
VARNGGRRADEYLGRGVANLLRQLERRGWSASAFYSAEYLSYLLADLASEESVEHFRAQLLHWSQRLGGAEHCGSPQHAALLILAGIKSGSAAKVPSRWVTTILDAHRPDGGWLAEPMWVVPAPRERSCWHQSRLLTSVLCYHALHDYLAA